jgi:PhnB protein
MEVQLVKQEECAMAVKAIPEGYHSVTPSLVVRGAAKLIDFVKAAFGAEEALRMPGPTGEIMHAEVRIGDSLIMLNDAMRQSPTTSALFLYVTDVDSVYQRALKAGATALSEPANMFWGDRMAQVKDQFGNQWSISTHVEDVPPQEMEKRAAAAMRQ